MFAPFVLTPAEFQTWIDEFVQKNYLAKGLDKLTALETAIDDTEAFIFREKALESIEIPTLYMVMGYLWLRLADAQYLHNASPETKA